MDDIQKGPVQQKKQSKTSRFAALLFKLCISLLCFWYISRKINLAQAMEALNRANWLLLFFSIVAYTLSKLVSAFRLNIYFRNINLRITGWQNVKLYWLGMFYNLFLPGSISGDAYKVVLLNRHLRASYKKTSAAVLLDRFSGLLGLGVLLCLYGLLVFDNPLYEAVLIFGSLAAIGSLYFVVKFFFAEFLQGFFPTFLSGILVQAIQAAGVYLILSALHIGEHQQQWVFIFLAASVIAVLPLSLGGGLGTREFVFVEGAAFFHLDPHPALIISLLFYLTSVAGAVWGAYFIFNNPLINKPEKSR